MIEYMVGGCKSPSTNIYFRGLGLRLYFYTVVSITNPTHNSLYLKFKFYNTTINSLDYVLFIT